jgi:hypothetical protein
MKENAKRLKGWTRSQEFFTNDGGHQNAIVNTTSWVVEHYSDCEGRKVISASNCEKVGGVLQPLGCSDKFSEPSIEQMQRLSQNVAERINYGLNPRIKVKRKFVLEAIQLAESRGSRHLTLYWYASRVGFFTRDTDYFLVGEIPKFSLSDCRIPYSKRESSHTCSKSITVSVEYLKAALELLPVGERMLIEIAEIPYLWGENPPARALVLVNAKWDSRISILEFRDATKNQDVFDAMLERTIVTTKIGG